MHYRAGPEVEFGLTSPAWARLPLDVGTARVVRDGFRVLYDPEGLLAGALRAAAPSTDDLVVNAPGAAVARRLHLQEEGVRSRAIRVGADQHDARVFAAFPSDVDRVVT